MSGPARLNGFVGMQFTPHNTDSIGTIVEALPGSVRFVYDHDPDRSWTMSRADFTVNFARARPRDPVLLWEATA